VINHPLNFCMALFLILYLDNIQLIMSVFVERFLKVRNLFCEIYIVEVNVMSDIVVITHTLIGNN